jgi:hypothetical protein
VLPLPLFESVLPDEPEADEPLPDLEPLPDEDDWAMMVGAAVSNAAAMSGVRRYFFIQGENRPRQPPAVSETVLRFSSGRNRGGSHWWDWPAFPTPTQNRNADERERGHGKLHPPHGHVACLAR